MKTNGIATIILATLLTIGTLHAEERSDSVGKVKHSAPVTALPATPATPTQVTPAMGETEQCRVENQPATPTRSAPVNSVSIAATAVTAATVLAPVVPSLLFSFPAVIAHGVVSLLAED